MRTLTSEWVEKAENDFAVADLVLHGRTPPIPDAACFHCQQVAEKYLKAFLQERAVEFPRQHNLIPLMELCMAVDPSFQSLLPDLESLESFAVAIRYPGATVSPAQAVLVFEAARRVRGFIQRKLEGET
jgi:HEPN domain-containing protein